jgi:hypothetical protein
MPFNLDLVTIDARPVLDLAVGAVVSEPEGEIGLTGGAEVADRIVLTAMRRDAGLDEELARRFTELALQQIHEGVDVSDAPELARRLLASEPGTGASAASVVAAATADVLSGAGD